MASRNSNIATDAGQQGQVHHVDTCTLTAAGEDWEFARKHAAEIDTHWRLRCLNSPSFFNGTVYMMADHEIAGGVLRGRVFATEFKAFLYWRDHGAPDRTVYDVFGSALLRSDDGAVLLGRQRAGNINAGLVYLPGGFIDRRDVDRHGRVDIAASVLREVLEETGLAIDRLKPQSGFLVTVAGQQVSIAVYIRIAGHAAAVKERIEESLRGQENPELEAIVTVRSLAELAALEVPRYALVLLTHLLDPK